MTTHSSITRIAIAAFALAGAVACTPKPPPDPVVPKAATIKSFTVSATSLEKADDVTLSWEVENATRISVTRLDGTPVAGVDAQAQKGQATATVEQDTLFVLTARGEGGNDARSVAVDVTSDVAQSLLFGAVPTEIIAGEETTLVWSITGHDGAVTIKDAAGTTVYEGDTQTGSVAVKPAFSTTYTLSVAEQTATAEVAVGARVFNFSANTTATDPGANVTLTWNVGGASEVTLSRDGAGVLVTETEAGNIVDGSFTDTVPSTLPSNGLVTYRLAARHGDAVVKATQIVYVSSNPVVKAFNVPPYSRDSGTFQISWQTANANRVDVEWNGEIVHQAPSQAQVDNGTLTLTSRPGTQIVRLHVRNARGGLVTVEKAVSSVGVPTTATFTATPSPVVNGGEPAKLTWTAPNARHVVVQTRGGHKLFETTGVDAESGSVDVYPNKLTEYVLIADNTLGDKVTPEPTVTVDVTNPARLTFSPTEAPLGATISVTGHTAVGNGFITGLPHTNVLKNASGAEFVDIATNGGIDIDYSGPDTSAKNVELPATFTTRIFGTPVSLNELTVSINGWFKFNTTSISGPDTPTPFPTTALEPLAIAPFWADLYDTDSSSSGTTSEIYVRIDNETGENRLIVQWDGVAYDPNRATSSLTFQAQVYESGKIVFAYETLQDITGAVPSIGVTNSNETAFAVAPGIPAPGDTFTFFGPATLPVNIVTSATPYVVRISIPGTTQDLIVDVTDPVIPRGKIAIREVNYNPATGKGEWFKITNESSSPVDLSEWFVEFATNSLFDIPAGTILPANGQLLFGGTADAADASSGGPAVDVVYGTTFTMPNASGYLSLVHTGVTYEKFSWNSAGTAGTSLIFEAYRPDLLKASAAHALSCPSTATYGSGQKGTPGTATPHCLTWKPSSIPGAFQAIALTGTPIPTLQSTGDNSIDALTANVNFVAAGGRAVKIGDALYGDATKPITVSSNGWLSLVTTTSAVDTNPSLPSTTAPNGTFAVLWDDLAANAATPGKPSGVFWQQFDPDSTPATGDEYTLISWENWKRYSTSVGSELNFQIKILEGTGSVEYHYGLVGASNGTFGNGDNATIWIEAVSGLIASKILVNEPLLVPNSAYRFTYTP